MKRNNDEGGGEEEGETKIENKMQPQLPHELITEILLRLPVKSLIRFKSVCKSWLSLISHPHFATSHFNLIAVERTQRIIFITSHASEARSIDFQTFLCDAAATASLNLHFLHPQSNLTIESGGSCRGFLFLRCYHSHNLSNPFHSLYLWNPSTGIDKRLPWSPIATDMEINFFTYLYGFGYDPSTDDYLVILGSYDPDATNVLTHLEFFSLRANTWKEIEGAHLPYRNSSDYPSFGTLFNGAIHWLACRANMVRVILAFDLTERRISEISLPIDSDFYHVPADRDLWIFGGFMSMWAIGYNTFEIWVMKDYGVHSSWTKTLDIMTSDPYQYFSYTFSTNCGDIVKQLLKHRPYGDHPHGSQVAIYTESLLPLPLPQA